VPSTEQRRAERRELWQRWDRKLPNNPFVRRQMAGAANLR